VPFPRNPEVIEKIAFALEVPPEVFAEYLAPVVDWADATRVSDDNHPTAATTLAQHPLMTLAAYFSRGGRSPPRFVVDPRPLNG
jgi:hypothetical protein